MKSFLHLISLLGLLFLGSGLVSAQTSVWTWLSGSNVIGTNCVTNSGGTYCGQPGVFGTQGSASATNQPGGHYFSMTWTGKDGNLWFYGGYGIDSTGAFGNIDDLWEYDLSSGEWTWWAGSSTFSTNCATNIGCVATNYGDGGIEAATNTPGSRYGAYTWTDTNGNLWLFGGLGYGKSASSGSLVGYYDDMWKFDISTHLWVWFKGSDTLNIAGIYGTQGVGANGNFPGSRAYGQSWSDTNGNLWLFGGTGLDKNYCVGLENDLWEYSLSINQWIWQGGTSVFADCSKNLPDAPGNYGTQGVAAPTNVPSGRTWTQGWTDTTGNFWLYGGATITSADVFQYPNDLWSFSPTTNEWTWINGSSTIGPNNGWAPVENGAGSFAASNTPGSRWVAVAGIGGNGYPLLFGGETNTALYCDLWTYDPTANLWAWLNGSFTNCNGQYGTEGAPDVANYPGERSYALSWSGKDGNFYVFGGFGEDSTGTTSGLLNDLWRYVPGNGPYAVILNWSPTTPINYGTLLSAAQFDAAVYYGGSNVSADGTFTYYVGPVSGGVVATTSTLLPVGSDQLCVQWTPLNDYLLQYKPVSGCATIVVKPVLLPTTTTLSASLNTIFISNPLTLTANVASTVGTPAGNVTFYLGSAPLTTVTLDSTGSATYTFALGDKGSNQLKAVYSGSTTYATSTSSTLVVDAVDFAVAMSTPASVIVPAAGTASYSFTVEPVSPATTFPQPITLSLTGMPVGVTYSLSQSTIDSGSGSTKITLTLNSPLKASSVSGKTTLFAIPALGLPLLLLVACRRRRLASSFAPWLRMLALTIATAALGFAITGCDGLVYVNQGTVTVTATSIDLAHTGSFVVNVN